MDFSRKTNKVHSSNEGLKVFNYNRPAQKTPEQMSNEELMDGIKTLSNFSNVKMALRMVAAYKAELEHRGFVKVESGSVNHAN